MMTLLNAMETSINEHDKNRDGRNGMLIQAEPDKDCICKRWKEAPNRKWLIAYSPNVGVIPSLKFKCTDFKTKKFIL